jgi:uncharacterized membrane protein YfcA
MDTYFIPVVCAGFSSIARGLTQYGDAIIFHVCSASFQIVIQSSSEVANIQFSVLCTAIMSITSLPLSIYLARSHIFSNLPYGFSLSVFGLCFLPLGTYTLFLGNIQILEIFIGIFFMLFAMFRLTSVILQKSKNAPDTTIPDITIPDITTTTTTKDPVTDINDGTDLIVNYPISSSSGLLHQIFQWIDSKVIQISTTYSPSFSLLIFAITGSIAGFLNALMGTGGPPQMAAFSILNVAKDDIRAIATIYATLELPVRIALWVKSAGSVWNPERDVSVYLSVAIASIFGFLIGSFFRARVNTSAVSTMMLVLIYLGAIVLLGGARSMMVALICLSVSVVFIIWLMIVWKSPEVVKKVFCIKKSFC